VLVMHPGPMNRGVEIAVDPSELPGDVITQQVANGIAVRMAVLFDALGSGGDDLADASTTPVVTSRPSDSSVGSTT
jgi:aspartate carbamoyltransferase catalytic subunit